jgi:WD40 repeat protein
MMSRNANIRRGLTLRHTLRGHTDSINRIAWSTDGAYLASASFDGSVRIWDGQTGNILHRFRRHLGPVFSIAWSVYSQSTLASCGNDGTIVIYDLLYQPPEIRHLKYGGANQVHDGNIYDVAWQLEAGLLASCSEDHTIRIWLHLLGKMFTFFSQESEVFCLAWKPRRELLASGAFAGPIRLWDTSYEQNDPRSLKRTLRGHTGSVYSLAWSPDGVLLASGSEDHTIGIWEPLSGKRLAVLEGHTDAVTSVSFSHDWRLLASKSRDGTVRLWRTDTWAQVGILPEPASDSVLAGLAFHPNAPILATLGENDRVIRVWDLDIPMLLGLTPTAPSVYYTNAKVVLVGNSGVGKTALGRALTGLPFVETASSHGRYVRDFDNQIKEAEDGSKEQRETFLWDLAGQPNYRLVHQLHLSDVALALVIFSNMDDNPLSGVAYWVRALRTARSAQDAGSLPLKKFLVEARADRGTLKMSADERQALLQKWGFDGYFTTSSQEGWQIAELSAAIKEAIQWEALPRVTSTQLFLEIKTFLTEVRTAGQILTTRDDLYHGFLRSHAQLHASTEINAEFDTCLGRAEAQGLLHRLSFGGLILLQPELLDAYASALINTAGEDPEGLGSVLEARVRAADFAIPQEVRVLSPSQERLLLLAMIEDLLRYEIVLREEVMGGTYLVFPSEVTRKHANLPDPKDGAVIFTFEGPALNIYATLAVRLSHSGFFQRQALWQDAVTYTARVGGICGIELRSIEDGKGEFALFFDDNASEETRFQFEEYIKVHLERYALAATVQRRRIFRCPTPSCKEPLTDGQVTGRLRRGHKQAECPACGQTISLLDGEERLAKTPDSLVREIDMTANKQVKQEAAISIVQGKVETTDFDVFLCHNGEDKAEVRRIGELLKQQGILPWLDEWELRPGLPWQRALEEQIGHIKSAAVFVGSSGVGPWQHEELDAFLRQFNQRKCPVIPVLLPGVPATPELPLFLGNRTWVDFRTHDPDPLARLIWGITGKRALPV